METKDNKMVDEVTLKPKISCPECREFLPDTKITSHIERHRPSNPPGPETSVCSKGCGRNLTKTELKEHIDFCDGSLPLPSKELTGTVSVPKLPQAQAQVQKVQVQAQRKPQKEERMAGKVTCPKCGKVLKSGKALGGHMTAHLGRPRNYGRKSAGKAVKPVKTAAKPRGRKVAPSPIRPGGILPPPPRAAGNNVSFLKASIAAKAKGIAAELRSASSQKKAQAQQLLVEAAELEKMAERADQLL